MRLEPIVDAAIATLQANLPTAIAALNAQTSDFDLEVVPNDAYHYGVQQTIVTFPAIEVAGPDFDLTNLAIEQLEADVAPVVMTMVWLQDADSVRLWRSLDRYSHCMLRTLLAPGAFGQAIVDRVVGRTRLDPETRDAPETAGGFLHVYFLADTFSRV